MKTLFITGASGFIGSHLMRRLDTGAYQHIYCLGRAAIGGTANFSKYKNVTFLRGSLFDSDIYSRQLAQSDMVCHLAAVTGKSKNEEYFNVNATGTRFLLEQCLRAGVKKFCHISSIAVKFKDVKHYPYAQSKIRAEQYVRESGIPYTIVRPTIVIGEDSPILISLLKLANAPVIPIVGDGSAMIQPIFVEDLISSLLAIIRNFSFDNETLDIGGPEQISIERFMRLIRKLSSIKEPKVFRVPARPVVSFLILMEKYFLSFLPLTAGQLATFLNDGTIDKNRLWDQQRPKMLGVKEMLETVLAPVKIADSSMQSLQHECLRFTEYLVDCDASAYIQEKYAAGHRTADFQGDIGFFDAFLIRAANKNTLLIRFADIFTSVFYRQAVLRKKLVLLLAILESNSITYSKIDVVTERSKCTLFIKLLQMTLNFSICLVVSCVLFFPVRALCYFRSLSTNSIL